VEYFNFKHHHASSLFNKKVLFGINKQLFSIPSLSAFLGAYWLATNDEGQIFFAEYEF